jgi:hydrogenase-4 component F
MGLAPLHTWLPDAHSEAPSAASALLSGALLNLAFLGILRAQQALEAAGLGDFGRELLVGFGLFSIAVAAGFLLIQRDFKRLLAYSSVEHMGILALAVGIGKTAIYGGMLHAVNHSLTKGMLFLVAGNVYAAYGSKEIASVRGVQRALPVSGILWLAGFVLIAGVPPSGLFVSEFVVVRSALELGHPWIAALTLALLGAAFVGMASAFLTMGSNEPTRVARRREPLVSVLPPAALGAAVCVLGVFMPPPLERALLDAARALGGFGG